MENICTLCQVNPATKTNSHIVPSFLVAMVASYDGSYARGKEIMFTIDSYKTRVYTGAIPSTEYERIFNYPELTEERIEQELSQNSVADDYIFCPTCEKNLAKYLEGPYAEFSKLGKKIDASIPLLFWISVIWRMSVAGTFGFKLKSHQEEYLQQCINQYFKLKKENQDVSSYSSKIGLEYKLLYCKDYSKNNGSMIFARHDEQTDSISLFIEDDSEGNYGLMKTSRTGISPYMTLEKWNAGDVKTIEHIAPQTNDGNWDDSIYDIEKPLVHTLGNLTLLPQDINSSVGNKGWKEKYLYYLCISTKEQDVLDEINNKAKEIDVELNPNTVSLLQNCTYNTHMSPVISAYEHGTEWNAGLIQKRTERILDIAWEFFHKWLY